MEGTLRRDRGCPVGSPSLPSKHPTERLAVWLQDRNTLQRQAGSGLPGPYTVPVADRVAASGSQHPVAVLPETPPEHEGTAQADREDGGGDEVGVFGCAGGGRTEGGRHENVPRKSKEGLPAIKPARVMG